ncbi:MAG: L,D-transpeptidase family protein [Anaerolineales bacterium]|nr:L,D-transpeptidase family protein [Anaerolineales bacterium]
MSPQLTRREWLKLGLLSAGSIGALAFREFLPEEDRFPLFGYGRVTADAVPVRAGVGSQFERVGWRHRDAIIPLLEQVLDPQAPAHNQRWYRVVGGYVYSAYIQLVHTNTHPVLQTIPENGQAAEVTVPYSQAMRLYRTEGWQPVYRLYYQSLHWITGLAEGPDGQPWYELYDDRIGVRYHVRAAHLRPIPAEEITPLSPEVPAEDKRIEVSLSAQTVTCYEAEKVVFHTSVSTGVGGPTNNNIPRHTPQGRFRIGWKTQARHMGDGNLTSDILAYELPGVPWCCFFVATGVAFHGTYWHDNYGTKMSSGCVNLRPDEAKWLFRWTTPAIQPAEWYVDGVGTLVEVIE